MIASPDRLPEGADLIVTDPEILGGTPVFKGTRVPIRALFDHLAATNGLEEFLVDFPYVTREQAVGVIRLVAEQVGRPGQAA